MQYRKLLQIVFSLILVIAIVAQPTIFSMNSSVKALSDQTDEINELKEEGKQIEADLNALKSSDAEQASIEKQLKKQIENTQSQIYAYTSKIIDFDNQISAKKAEINQKNAELDNTKYTFKQRLRSIYMSGGDITTISMLMSSDDFADLLSRAELTKSVSAYDNALMEKIVKTISEINKSKAEIEDKQADIVELRKSRTVQQEQLNQQLNGVTEARATLSNKITDKEKEKDDNAEETRIAQKENDAYWDSLETDDPASNVKYDGSQFAWPVRSCYSISSGFGSRWGTVHKGIDISNGSIYGQPVIAAADGVVTNAYNGCTHDYKKNKSCGCGGGYGNNVVISHGNNNGKSYATLYGHLRSTAVSKGQTVKKGQVIGYVGCTGYSTGPHLHFEIRVNGSAQNPMNFFN